jgi:hypothetical protein
VTIRGPATEVVHPFSEGQADNIDMSLTSSQESARNRSPSPDSQFVWPADTDICFQPGTSKVMLTNQRPLLRVIITEAMEQVRADLLFNYAFPNPLVALTSIRNSLITCGSRVPNAETFYRRLLFDEQYMTALIPLVSFLNSGATIQSILTPFYSCAHGFHSSEVKSKNVVVFSLRMNSWPALWMQSSQLFRSSYRNIIIHSRRPM